MTKSKIAAYAECVFILAESDTQAAVTLMNALSGEHPDLEQPFAFAKAILSGDLTQPYTLDAPDDLYCPGVTYAPNQRIPVAMICLAKLCHRKAPKLPRPS